MTSTVVVATADRPSTAKWRSTVGRLVTVVFTFAAIGAVVGQIGSLRDVGAALARAEWAWVVVAAVLVAASFPVSAVGVRAGLGTTVPLGSVTALQLASKFANLVTPAGLGSTALNVRFMRRQGVDATSAITSEVASN